MPPTPAIVARTAARVVARRARPRAFSSSSSSGPSSIGQQLAELDEVDRAQVMKILDKKDAEMKMNIDKHIDMAKAAWRDSDPSFVHWLCDMCRVPKGEFRDKMAWRCLLGGVFLSAGAFGRFSAKIEQSIWKKENSDATDADVDNAIDRGIVDATDGEVV